MYPSVAFVFPVFSPASCGVSDYVIRIFELLESKGVRCGVICENAADLHESIVRQYKVQSFDSSNFTNWDVLSVQYVPRGWRGKLRQVLKLAAAGEKVRIHMMVHECWRFSHDSYRLPWKQWHSKIYEVICLLFFYRKIRPATVATTNPYYQAQLRNRGVSSKISPMPANIPYEPAGSEPLASHPMDLLREDPTAFVWFSFGGIYTLHWSYEAMFAKMKAAEQKLGRNFYFVFGGKQRDEELADFREMASRYGFAGRITVLGLLNNQEINRAFAKADAYFTGVSFDYWERSSTVLTAVEQGIPIYFAHGLDRGNPKSEMLSFFYDDIQQAVEVPRALPASVESIHQPDRAAEHFITNFLVKTAR